MAKKRDTVTYELRDKGKVVYVGTTNDPDRRADEHKDQGKRFTTMGIISSRMTEEGAKKKEAARLKTYRKNQGKNPKYNKDSDG